MELPLALNRKIVDFLVSIPNIEESDRQRELILGAGFDNNLASQIKSGISSGRFIRLLLPILMRYGTLEDDRHALVALLESAKDYIGKARQQECETLIQELYDRKYAKPPQKKSGQSTQKAPQIQGATYSDQKARDNAIQIGQVVGNVYFSKDSSVDQ